MLDELEKYLNLKADFVEIRASKNVNTGISIKKREVFNLVSGSSSAFSVRVLDKGNFGFAATNDIARLAQAAKKALKLSKVSAKKPLNAKLSEEKAHRDNVRIKPKKNPLDISLDEKTKDLLEMNKEMKISSKIFGYETYYAEGSNEWYYLNSEGSRLSVSYNVSRLYFYSFAKDKSVQSAGRGNGGMYGYELLDMHRDKAVEVSKKALLLAKSDPVPSGVYDVVLGPRMTGVLSHEAFGHACEADHVITGESVLEGKINRKLASDLVSIYDDPTIERNHGSYPYDDEGVKTKKKYLLKDGVLQSYLHSRETAAELETKSTGNARAETVFEFPIVRMSNVIFEPRDSSFEELTDIKRGLYAEGMKGGQVDPVSGAYQFAAEGGFLIENGKLTKPVRDVVIFGDILTTLKSVDAVGKKIEYNHIGMCGKKGQHVRVSDGGPNIRVRGVRVGGK